MPKRNGDGRRDGGHLVEQPNSTAAERHVHPDIVGFCCDAAYFHPCGDTCMCHLHVKQGDQGVLELARRGAQALEAAPSPPAFPGNDQGLQKQGPMVGTHEAAPEVTSPAVDALPLDGEQRAAYIARLNQRIDDAVAEIVRHDYEAIYGS